MEPEPEPEAPIPEPEEPMPEPEQIPHPGSGRIPPGIPQQPDFMMRPPNDAMGEDDRVDDIIVAAEPFPDFRNPSKAWSIVWPMYTYTMGSLFAFLCLYSLFSMVTMFLSKRQPMTTRRKNIRPFIIAINSQMMLLGMCRAIDLLVDPYNIRQTFPPVIYAIIFNIPFPCLSSAFGLVNWVIIQVSKLKMNSASKIRSITFLTTVIVSHYIVVIAVGIFTHLVMRMNILLIFCQGFFVVWGMLLCVGFFIGAWKIHTLEKYTRASLYKQSHDLEGTLLTPKINRKSWISLSHLGTPPSSPSTARRGRPVDSERRICKTGKVEDKANAGGSTNQVYSITAEMLTPLSVLVTTMDVEGGIANTKSSKEVAFQSPDKSNTHDEGRLPGYSTRRMPTRMTLTNIVLETTQTQSNACVMNSIPSPRNPEIQVQRRSRRKPRSKTAKVLRISGAAALLGFVASGLNLFGILVVFAGGDVKLGGDGIKPGLWEWYGYQVMSRFVELSMACTMAYFTCEPALRTR